jgi:hypothetical protein
VNGVTNLKGEVFLGPWEVLNAAGVEPISRRQNR